MKHTPGPWHIDFDGQISTKPTETDRYSRRICSLPWDSHIEFNQEPNKSNARLIAAGPELLNALEMVRSVLCRPIDREAYSKYNKNSVGIQTCDKVDAAIAKAKP